MVRRFLFAGLTMLALAVAAQADVHRNTEHQFEAEFPTKSEQIIKPIEEGGKIVLAFSKDDSRSYMLGAAVETEAELSSDDIGPFAKAFIDGLMNTRKNASIVKEEELKLNDQTPQGNSFVIKHETGWVFCWATIENGKGYFVVIEGNSEDSLNSESAKKFQKSVRIKGVK